VLVLVLGFPGVEHATAQSDAPSRTTMEQLYDRTDFLDLEALERSFNLHVAFLRKQPQPDAELYVRTSQMGILLWNTTFDSQPRIRYAKLGHQAAKLALQKDPQDALANLFSPVALLMFTFIKGPLNTLHHLGQVRDEAKRVAERFPDVIRGSAFTLLGSLYMEAPVFPVSFGDRTLSKQFLRKAVDYEQNSTSQLMMARLLLRQGQQAQAKQYLERTLKIPPIEAPRTVTEKNLQFWWYVDQIRALVVKRALAAGTDPGKIDELFVSPPAIRQTDDLRETLRHVRAAGNGEPQTRIN